MDDNSFGHLLRVVERIESLERHVAVLQDDKSAAYQSGKDIGLDVKGIKRVLDLRRNLDPDVVLSRTDIEVFYAGHRTSVVPATDSVGEGGVDAPPAPPAPIHPAPAVKMHDSTISPPH